MENQEILIGDTFIIGVGTYNMNTKMNSQYVEAKVVGLNAYDDKDYFSLEMIDFGGSIQKRHRSTLTERT